MSIKYPKNVIVVVSVIAALLAATVLLGGYANNKPANTQAPAKACQSNMAGCPMTAQTASCPKMMVDQDESTGCPKTPCTTGCPKPCYAGGNAEGACDNPCPIPCPKPCCAEEGCCGTAGATGCPMTAVEADTQ